MVYVEWLLRATHLAINPGLCGGSHLRVHLWMATQEQRDYYVFHALLCFQCSLRQYGLCLDHIRLWGPTCCIDIWWILGRVKLVWLVPLSERSRLILLSG